jgi:hypothetical protein
MPDFTQGYPIQEQQPSPGTLTPTESMQIQQRGFGIGAASIGNVVGEDYITASNYLQAFNDGSLWSYNEQRKVETNREHSDILHFMSAMAGGKEDVATLLGLATDPTKGMIIRQLMGKSPLTPIQYGDSEITPELLVEDRKQLESLLATQEGIDIDSISPDQMTSEQQQIRALTNKLAYANAQANVKSKLGFNWWDWFTSSDVYWGGMNKVLNAVGLVNQDNAKGDADIINTLKRYDPNFDYKDFFDNKFADPIVKQALLEHGITDDFISQSPNQEHAMLKITQSMLSSDLQKRAATYKPSTWDSIKNTGAGFVDFIVDTPVGATLAPIQVAGTVFGLGTATLGAIGVDLSLAPISEAVAQNALLSFGRGAAESLYKLPLGMVPHYMHGSTLLSRVPGYFLAGTSIGGLSSYSRQANEIAFGAATMYANPNVKLDVDYSDAAIEAFVTGGEFALMFGVGGGLLGSAIGAAKNRFKGVMIDNEIGLRNPLDRRWSLDGTVLGNTIEVFRKKDTSLIDASPIEKVKTEALLENKDVTPEKLAGETVGHAERVETREALKSTESAEGSPEDVGTRRYTGESVADYTKRVAPSRGVRNIVELATEVGRRDPDAAGSVRLGETDNFPQMSTQDQIRTLVKTKEVLEEARKLEENSVGLPAERERVYNTLEQQRKSWIRNLGKRLTPDEFKLLKAELKGERKTTTSLPELLKTSKDTAKPLAERKAAASEATAQMLEAARSAATAPERAKVIKESAPKEVTDAIDAMVMEHGLTGNISKSSADVVRKSVIAPEEVLDATELHQRLRRAISANRISPDRIAKIKEVKSDYTEFINLVSGNKERAQRLYDFVNKLVDDGLLTEEERVLLLSSVVHMNFDLKGFDVKYMIERDPDFWPAGAYLPKDKTIVLNGIKLQSSDRVISVFLHELGHSLFAEHMNGELYMKNLQLFNNMRRMPKDALYVESIYRKDAIEMDMWGYHFQNAEENFVQLLATVLKQEASTVINPLRSDVVRGVLSRMIDSLMQTVHALEDSVYYDAGRKLVNDLVTMDNEVANKTVSVRNFVKHLSEVQKFADRNQIKVETATERNVEIANNILQTQFKKSNPNLKLTPSLTLDEFKLLFADATEGHALLSYAISYEFGKPLIFEGKVTTQFAKFIQVYRELKKAQLNTLRTKMAMLLADNAEFNKIAKLSPKERSKKIWDAVIDTSSEDKTLLDTLSLPTTYEERALAKIGFDVEYMVNTAGDLVDHIRNFTEAPEKASKEFLSREQLDMALEAIEQDSVVSTPLINQLRDELVYNDLQWFADILQLSRNVIYTEPYTSFVTRFLKKTGILDAPREDVRMSPPEPSRPYYDPALPDLGKLLDINIKGRVSGASAIEMLLKDKNSLAPFKLMYILTDVLKVEESLAQAVMVGSEKLKTNEARIVYALQKLHKAMKNKNISWDNGNFVALVSTNKTPVRVEMPSEKTIPSVEVGSPITNTDRINKIIEKLYGKLVNLPEAKQAGLSQKLNQFWTEGTSTRNALIRWIEKEPRTEGQIEAYIRKAGTREGSRPSKESSYNVGEGQEQSANLSTEDAQKAKPTSEIKARDIQSEAYVIMKQFHDMAFEKDGKGIFNEKQIKDLEIILQDRVVTLADGKEEMAPVTLEYLANQWGIKKAGVSMRVKRLETVFADILGLTDKEFANLRKKSLTRAEIKDLSDRLENWKNKIEEIEAIKPEPVKPKPEAKMPSPDTIRKAAIAMAQKVAIEAKMEAKAEPVPVVVPVSEPSSGHAIVETPNIKPDAELPVVHTDKVADALVSGEPEMTKTAVTMTVKKTLKMPGKFTSSKQALQRLFQVIDDAYPEQVGKISKEERRQFVIDKLREKGYDAVVDEAGNTIPLTPVKKVGTRVVKAEPEVKPTEDTKLVERTTLTVDAEGAPVVTTEIVEEPVKAPSLPVATAAETPTLETKVEKTISEVAKLPEAEKLERKINADEKALNENGMDRSFLRRFTKAYWSSKVEESGKGTITTGFKSALEQFVVINNFIAEANKRVFGSNIMERFWAKVNEIYTKEVLPEKLMPPGLRNKTLTYKQMLAKAAEAMREEGKPDFVPPVLPEDFKFIKEDAAGNVRLSGKDKKTKAISEAALKDGTKAEPPPVEPKTDAEGKPVPLTVEEAKPVSETPEEKPADVMPAEKLIDNAIDQSESGASRLWRFNSFVGYLFGGDNTGRANWWRSQMNKLAKMTQARTKLGSTIRSPFNAIAFLSRFADDTRAQTGHVVAAGTRPFKTMLQVKMDEGMVITRILRAYSMFANTLGKAADRVAINEYMYDSLRKGEAINRAELLKRGVSVANADAATKQANYLMDMARSINDRILYMEKETGRLVTVNNDGTPVDPNKYAPVQFDHEALSRLGPEGHYRVVQAMADVRRTTKLKDPRLDINTLIVMGWLDVAWNPETKGYDFFSKDRIIKQAEGTNMFSKDTLTKLRVDEQGKLLPEIMKDGTDGNKAEVLRLLRKGNPEKRFVLESDDRYTVYRVPSVVEDLAPVDKVKYMEAVRGNTAMYTPYWKERLAGKDLVYREMEEMFDFKTKKYPYNQDNHGLNQPMLKLADNNKAGITVKGLTPEEVLSHPELKGIIRTNVAEAYFHFVKGRYFDLAFQGELDRIMGTKGITWEMVSNRVAKTTTDEVKKMARDSMWNSKELEAALEDVRDGIERLKEEFRYGAETLPILPPSSNLGARASSAAIRWKFSVGYGVSQFTEIMHELAKETPEFWRIPGNIVKTIRFVLGDYRFSKNKLFQSELGDMTFILESLKTDLSNRYMGEVGYGTLSMDSSVKTGAAKIGQRIRDARGAGETLLSLFEAGADSMQALGSLGAQTQAVRVLGKTRLQRNIWKYINSGSLEKLLVALQRPELAAELAALKKAAGSNQAAQVKLWKRFAGIARENGFGFDQHDAMLFLKYGFTDPESVRLFKWAMEKVGHSEGRVNMHQLYDIVDFTRKEPIEGINPDALERVISNYQFMLEDRITKEVASEVRGLNKQTDLEARSSLGRLWYSLTSFIRSYQDNVVMGYGSKSTIKYLAAGLFLYGAIDATTSLFKEYLAGRKMDDITKELQDHPSGFVIRGIARTPFLGTYNGYLEAALAGASALNGGTYKTYGLPFMPAGATAGEAALTNMYNDAKGIISEDSVSKKVKAASGLLGFTDIVNKSHAAIPIRILEDMGAIERQSSLGTLLDLVHRNPYPYSKQARQGGAYEDYGYTPEIPEPTMSRTQESVEYMKALNNQFMQQYPQPIQRMAPVNPTPRVKKTNPFGSTSLNSGVSGILGDLLDSAE